MGPELRACNVNKKYETLVNQFSVIVKDDLIVPPESECLINAKIVDFKSNSDCIFYPFSEKLSDKGLLFASTLNRTENSETMLRLINTSNCSQKLFANTKIGYVEYFAESKIESLLKVSVDRQLRNKPQKHLVELVHSIENATNMDDNEKKEVIELVNKFSELFSKVKGELGKCNITEHEIITSGFSPINIKQRRLPLGQQDEVDRQINEMLKNNVIRPSESPWNAPLVLVRKKSGDIRICVDYRRLNAETVRPIYPIPEAKELFDSLAGSKYFSTIDLSSAYHQIPICEKDKAKTAFSTRLGQYEFNRMPFGLCGAPATFQRAMNILLRSENWEKCLIYLDDILIFGKSFKEHLERTNLIFTKLLQAGIKLAPAKCELFKEKLLYLGHIIDKKGFHPDPAKTEKIKNWIKPHCVEDMKKFLGFCNYYRRFIKDYSTIVTPLEKLITDSSNGKNYRTCKKNLLDWTMTANTSFETIKHLLCTAPVLSYPVKDAEYILDTDASHSAIGGILSQVVNGEEKVLEYGSRKLTRTEKNYCVTRKELLAVVHFCKQFRHYLVGRKFKIRTDHKALTWLVNWKEPNTAQYYKWISELEEFDFVIEHRNGSQHVNADCLSREPCQQCETLHKEPKPRRNVKVLRNLEEEESRESLLGNYHNYLGHIGMRKLYEILKKDGHSWENMYNDINRFVNNCTVCIERKDGKSKNQENIPINASRTFEKIMIDIYGPLPVTRNGSKYILAVVDVFSRYPMLIQLRNTETSDVINAILKHWIPIFGYPNTLVSDNARNLKSLLFDKFCKEFGIQREYSSPYHPQGNGIVERLARTVKDRVYAASKQFGKEWNETLPLIEMGLRASNVKNTKYSSHEIVFGNKLNLPWDKSASTDETKGFDAYIDGLIRKQNIIKEVIFKQNKPLPTDLKQQFRRGELVMVKQRIEQGLLKPKYFGPAKICKMVNEKTYELLYNGRRYVRHESLLKRCYKNQVEQDDGSGTTISSAIRQRVAADKNYMKRNTTGTRTFRNNVTAESGSRKTVINSHNGLQEKAILEPVRERPKRSEKKTERYGFNS